MHYNTDHHMVLLLCYTQEDHSMVFEMPAYQMDGKSTKELVQGGLIDEREKRRMFIRLYE